MKSSIINKQCSYVRKVFNLFKNFFYAGGIPMTGRQQENPLHEKTG